MEDHNGQAASFAAFSEALTCEPTVWSWHYDAEGNLLDTNCPEHVYHRIFEHTGCLPYMLEHGREDRMPLILSAALGILWGAAFEWRDDELRSCRVIGPVFNNEVNDRLLQDAIRRYAIDPAWQHAFQSAMTGIPVVSSILFFQYVIMLNFYITGEKIGRSDIRFQEAEPSREERGKTRTPRYQTYRAEQALLQMIRDGNLNYRSAMERAGQISSGLGISTADPVNRAILSCANFTALCTRAAIDGGLTPDTAYTVGDSYLQSLTECKRISDVRTVNHAMYEDFVQRVHRQRTNPRYTQQIQSCAAYIETHPEEALTLASLARQVGYSEYHLSRKFRAETGETIRDCIKKARVNRAKILLSTTQLSIKEISEQLRFCAPSHFAKTFREVTGALPQEYRRENRR